MSKYLTKLAYNCKWNEWILGDCSKSCGTGTRTNTRTVAQVENYGGSCTDDSTMIQECNTQDCPRKLTTLFMIFDHFYILLKMKTHSIMI